MSKFWNFDPNLALLFLNNFEKFHQIYIDNPDDPEF